MWTVWADATLNEGVVAITCAGLMFLVGGKSGERILEGSAIQAVDWSTLLLLGGGLGALQAMAVSTGFPFAIVLLLGCVAIVKGLASEPR